MHCQYNSQKCTNILHVMFIDLSILRSNLRGLQALKLNYVSYLLVAYIAENTNIGLS